MWYSEILCPSSRALKASTKDCGSVYTALKRLSASSESQLISEFLLSSLLMSAKQQKCCAVQQTLLMDFLKTKKKKKKKKRSTMASQRCRNPNSSHVLSAFLVEHERSAAYQDGRFKFSMSINRGFEDYFTVRSSGWQNLFTSAPGCWKSVSQNK